MTKPTVGYRLNELFWETREVLVPASRNLAGQPTWTALEQLGGALTIALSEMWREP